MKGSPTTINTIDFCGSPITGTITQTCLYDGSDDDPNSGTAGKVTTLTGNPYPSVMDLKLFLTNPTNNINLDGNVYFWEQKNVNSHVLTSYQGGYATWNPGSSSDPNHPGLYTPATYQTYDGYGSGNGNSVGTSDNYKTRRFAAVGQGFIVRNGSTNGGDFVIDNSMRLYMTEAPDKMSDGSQFGRSSNEDNFKAMSHNGLDYMYIVKNPTVTPQIRITSEINNTYIRENLIAFNQNRNNEFNKIGDAISPGILDTDTYFLANNYKLVIKSIAYDIDAKLPLGLKAENENNIYSITIKEMKDVSENIEVFIHDKELDTYTDIISNTFDISLPKGDYDNRFEIVFRNSSEVLDNEDITETIESFDVYQNNKIKEFIINNPKSHTIKSFTMFDVTGKVIFKKQNLGNQTQYTIPTNSISSGTYITKITTEQNIDISKKIIVKN
jgi:hypothetical protein